MQMLGEHISVSWPRIQTMVDETSHGVVATEIFWVIFTWGFMIQFDESYVSNWVEMFTNYKWLNIFCRGRSWRKGSITNEKFILPIWTMLAFPGVSFISYKSIRCAWAIARHVKRDLEHHSEKRSLVMFVMHSEPKWTSEPFCSCLEMILKHVSCIQELELQNRLIMAWLLFGIMSSRQ